MKYLLFTTLLFLSHCSLAQLSLTLTASDAFCYNSATGSVQASVSGGTPNYSYLWNTGAITDSISNLVAGNYQVTVTDAMGAIIVDSITIENPTTTITTSDESCLPMGAAMASVQVNSPIDSLFYVWTTDQNGVVLSVDSVITGIPANVYDADGDGVLDTVFLYIVEVSDTTGCSWRDTAYIGRTDSLNLVVLDNNNGTATAQPTGGTAPYSYLWSANANNQTTAMATGLFATTYLVTVTDSRGCVISDSVTISVGINQIASLETFDLYPNPNQGSFLVELGFKEKMEGFLEIKDVLGKRILKRSIEGQEIQEWIQLEDKAAGIYFLSLNVGGQIVTRKMEVLR